MTCAAPTGADHPGLVAALDVGVDTDRGLWLIHAALTGARPLRAVVGDDAPPTPAAVLGWALDLAGALVAAHAVRLVHGRLAPGIMLVDPHGAAHLLAAPSGLRPDDRPGAQDSDARALAAALRTILGSPEPDADPLAARLSTLLAAVAEGRAPDDGSTDPDAATVPAPGTLAPVLESALRRLGGGRVPDHTGEAPEGDTAAGATAVVDTSTVLVERPTAERPTAEAPTAVVPTAGAAGERPGPTTRVAVPAALSRPPAAGPTGPVRPVAGPPASSRWSAPGPPGGGPSWGSTSPVGPGPGHGPPPGVGPGGGGSRRADRTLLVLIGIVIVLILGAAVVLAVMLGGAGGSSPAPTPGRTNAPSVTDPGGRVVPALAVTPPAGRGDTPGRDRRGGLEMAHTQPTTPSDRAAR